jgi:hypothetical protein
MGRDSNTEVDRAFFIAVDNDVVIVNSRQAVAFVMGEYRNEMNISAVS